jgi:alkylation response protein AidB-like acyl-CoA dehydrogenase
VDFEFDENQELLRETVRRFLAEQAPITPYVREQLDTPSGTSPEVWAGLAALGVTGLLVPEARGGGAMGMVDMAVVLEEMGRAVHPGPFPSTAVAAASLLMLLTLDSGGGDDNDGADLLDAIAEGASRATVVLPISALAAVEPWAVRASGDRITGAIAHIADAPAADVFLVVATTDDGLGVFAVESGATGFDVTTTETVDATRKQGSVSLRDTPARRLGSGDAAGVVAATRDRMIAAAVVDGVGAAEQALAAAVAYAKEREQFGKPIGSFQAVQHLCAEMLQSVELGRAAAYYACWACDAADATERRRAVTMAAAFAGDGFYRVAASAIQVFGGVGFTWEHDIHLFYKRLLTLQLYGGPPHAHLEALATIALS